ncbi:MAG TPA: asparagine synthase (glutamine-hydrolyzing) [Gammaproteobacteria bacterium]
MCGIVGTVQLGDVRRYGPDDVRRMADLIRHRGPDDDGVRDCGDVVIGMRRLSIIDLAGGHQPIGNEDGSVWVVMNGEIYNFRELRRSLEALGHRFTTRSDTEVLVHLYEEHGEDFVTRLEGMFGFALWDANRRKLLLARDRLGIKPVYYWRYASGFAFSSEVKAFRALSGFSAAVDTEALSDYLALGYAVAPRTLFAGVSKLPPGTMLVTEGGSFRVVRYWEPPRDVDRSRSAGEWTEQVAAELDRAVESHLVSDVPLGAFLSGGIDSSAVACLMARHSDGPLNTYSIGYRGSAVADYYNELPFAKLVADQLGSRHREIAVQPDVARLLPKLLWHLEEPISDSAITTTYLVSELAAESVKVILSGVGGDELFAGYNRYLGSHYGRYYERIPPWLRRRVLPLLAHALPSGRQNRLMDLGRYAKRFIRADGLDWRQRYKLYIALADDAVLAALQRARSGPPADGFDAVVGEEESTDELLRLLRVDWRTQLSEDLLLLTDKMTMACSIECRVPFLDHRLVELVARIPAEQKAPKGRLKAILKDALRDVLPRPVLERRKRGFGAPVGAWFRQELVPLRRKLLDPRVVAARGLLDPAVVETICGAHDASREDYSDLLLVLLNLEIWSRLYLDGASHEDVAAELAESSLAA